MGGNNPLSNSLPRGERTNAGAKAKVHYAPSPPRETTARMQELEQRMEQLPRAGERIISY
jgi:hypothetical protein